MWKFKIISKSLSLMTVFAVIALNTGTTSANSVTMGGSSPPEPAGPPGTALCHTSGGQNLFNWDEHYSFDDMDWDVYGDVSGSSAQYNDRFHLSLYASNPQWLPPSPNYPWGSPGPAPISFTKSYYGTNMIIIDLIYPDKSKKCIKIVLTKYPDNTVRDITVTLNQQVFIDGPSIIPGYFPPTPPPGPTKPPTTTAAPPTTAAPTGPDALCGTRTDSYDFNGKTWITYSPFARSVSSRLSTNPGSYVKIGFYLENALRVENIAFGTTIQRFDVKYKNNSTKCIYGNFTNFGANQLSWEWKPTEDKLYITGLF